MLAIGAAGQPGHTLGVCPVPSRYCPSVARDTPGQCPAMSRPVPVMVELAKPRHTPHNFFFAHFAHFMSWKRPNHAAEIGHL